MRLRVKCSIFFVCYNFVISVWYTVINQKKRKIGVFDMANILIVEDEKEINELIRQNLKLVGHTCGQAYDGREALRKIKEGAFDLLILDVMLPYLSGFEVMKQADGIPVIFVTAKGRLEDKLKGLGLGAEDYLVKPFEILELIARVGVVLKRYRKEEKQVVIGNVAVDFEGHKVWREEKPVALSPREFELLRVLVRNANIALSRERLLELVWGFDYEGDDRTVDVHIQRLRKKLGFEEIIRTVYKMGYRLEIRR